MSNFPTSLDTDVELPPVFDNITEIGAEAINALRDAIFKIEEEIGLTTKGVTASLSDRLDVSLNPDGTLSAAGLLLAGVIFGPITNSMVSAVAAIDESKLNLNFSTTSLSTAISLIDIRVDVLEAFQALHGYKIIDHIAGTDFKHKLSHIDVDLAIVINNVLGVARNNTNAQLLVKDLNDEFVAHVKADGTLTGTIPPTNYAHVAAGIALNTGNFQSIPQTIDDVQKFSEFVDTSSLLLLGSRVQNFYSNGIPRSGRLDRMDLDGYAEDVVESTLCTTYLLYPIGVAPVDDIDTGDDIIEFFPTAGQLASNKFEGQFSKVKQGDLITVNYEGFTVTHLIDEVKYVTSGTPRYLVRINGVNSLQSSIAYARIDRTLYHENKWGALALAQAHNTIPVLDTLIAGHPRAAVVLGNGFDPDGFDGTHYNLYLQFYPNGNPTEKALLLPAIDVTGNQGTTPGKYTLDYIVEQTNLKLRAPGYNYRFIAFSYNGNFGIKLADAYNNASFSVISGIINSGGAYDQAASALTYPNNVVGDYEISNTLIVDPLAFGVTGSNVVSPAYTTTFSSVSQAQYPTKIHVPLKRNYYYVNGSELEKLKSEIETVQDTYGDRYWEASIFSRVVIGGSRVEVTYAVNADLRGASLRPGKTLVVQPTIALTDGAYLDSDYGRFIIKSINLDDCDLASPVAYITVYDAIHGIGTSPSTSSTTLDVKLYFNDDSIAFNTENANDVIATLPFKRYHEIFVDGNGHTFSHERARFFFDGSDKAKVNFVKVSPKLRGYNGTLAKQIVLHFVDVNTDTGEYSGYLYNGVDHLGPLTTGKIGEVVRFFDETNIDFIDFIFDLNNQPVVLLGVDLTIDLYPSLELNQTYMIMGACQIDDTTTTVKYLKDARPFGNTSEMNLSDSALAYISAGDKHLHENGIIQGFDFVQREDNKLYFKGGIALVDGKIVEVNDQITYLPKVRNKSILDLTTVSATDWIVCVNKIGELDVFPIVYDNSDKRIYKAVEPISLNEYFIDSFSFNELLTRRKNLTPIYLAGASVDTSGVLTYLGGKDIRRYVNQEGINFPFVWTDNGLTGNFRSFEAVDQWIKLAHTFTNNNSLGNNVGSKVVVRGFIELVDETITLDYDKKVVFEGDDGTICYRFDSIGDGVGLNIVKNVSFNNINFLYMGDLGGISGYSSTNLVNSGIGMIMLNASSSVVDYGNVEFNNCTFRHIGDGTVDGQRGSFINIRFSGTSLTTIKNIKINNNKFYANTQVNDTRAVIAIINEVPSTTPIVGSVKLLNCEINGNICDKNQLIVMTSETANYLGNQTFVSPGLVAINCSISNNICGAIGYCVAYHKYTNINSVTDTLYLDKIDNLIINNNNVNYIYTSDHEGKLFIISNTINDYILYGTGNVTISNNISGWIQVGYCSLDYSSLKIINNKLYARGATYLLNYSATTFDFAISVISTVLPAKSDVLIEGNTVTFGTYDSGVYLYNSCLVITCGAIITNNMFDGIESGVQSMITLSPTANNRSYLVKSNKFHRNTNTLTVAYINESSSSTSYGEVVNNFFDSTTKDGTIETLASLPDNWIYRENINQKGSVTIQLNDNNATISGSTASLTDLPAYSFIEGAKIAITEPDNVVAKYSSPYINALVPNTCTDQIYINFHVNLEKVLPFNVKVSKLKLGLWVQRTVALDVTAGTNQLELILSKSSDNEDVLDVRKNIAVDTDYGIDSAEETAGAVVISGNSAATQYFTLTASSPEEFISGKDYMLFSRILIKLKRAASGTILDATFSPLKVEYYW